MLTTVFLTFVLGLALATMFVGVGVGLVLRAVAERSRLHPSIDTGAPLDWWWSPGAPARFHRRLQSALLPICPARPARRRRSQDELHELVAVITKQAAMVDRELILAARLRGPARRARLRRLRGEVAKIEQVSYRVQNQRAQMASTVSPPRDEVLADVDARLDLLEAAHVELTAIEEASTAADPDAILRRIGPRPAGERGHFVARPRDELSRATRHGR
jgi:hypothetical protein